MSGPEHYAEAERLIDRHDRALGAGDYDYEAGADDLAAAQVHATLALAAANAQMLASHAWPEVTP